MTDDSKAQDAANAAHDSFPDSPPSATASCPINNPPGPPSPPTAWTVDDLKKNLAKCDGGTDIWAKAKAANGGKDPTVKTGASAIGSGGQVDINKGEITLDTGQDKCFATQVLIQELCNLSHKADFAKANTDCGAGDLSRDAFIRANEEPEYDGVTKVIQAFDACKGKWGCTTCEKEWARKYTTFDDYYNKALSNRHKEYYGSSWDTNCKAAYDTKHPPTPPPAPPPATPPAKKGCFIATAAYGSPMAPEVQFLRELRDDVLRKTEWGYRFFEDYWSYYYQMSPEIAAQMDRDPEFKKIIRWSIVTPMVNYLKLLSGRPRAWNLDNVEPELKAFLEEMKSDMESWLEFIELPENFEGLNNEAIINELNIALDLVLKEAQKIDAYLNQLLTRGELPLKYSSDEEAGLLT